ncbi:MAG TPA: alanine racemase [Chthoniobacteraceae bacterium]|nr:alanine racemase [Chthoniobacteraceae bacterium]
MSRLPYVAPTIQRLGAGPVNPFRLGASPCCAGIDGVSVAELTREYGSPLFVFSEKTLRDRYRDAYRAFSRRYPDVQFAWSYKTNYLNAICNLFHQEGSIAEVVSGFEYEKARGNGIPGNRIIFNGPCKERADLERAVAEGAMIQVDNIDELLTLASIAKGRAQGADGHSEPLAVALRINVNTGTHAVWSKFGFSADSGEALQVIRRLRSIPQLTLQGLHCHVGTFILDPEAYRVATKCLVALAQEVESVGVGKIKYLNLGGGFASHARLHYQYLPPDQVTPSMDRYADAICGTITQHWPKERDLPRLYLETGRALVDDAGYLLSTVVAVKTRPMNDGAPAGVSSNGHSDLNTALTAYGKGAPAHAGAPVMRNAVVLDAGVNLLYTAAWYQINILPARPCPDSPQPTTVYGCLCMNIDVIREETPLPGLTTGDQVVLHPVGAYNVTQSMQFITYRPAVVMVGLDGRVHLIRKRENLDYVQELERVPEYLASATHSATVSGNRHAR